VEGHTKTNCPKKKRDLWDEKPSTAGVVEGSHLGAGGGAFLTTAESPTK